jgi:hypothetical protein
MSDFPGCPCENPVASWTDRQLRWIPRGLVALTLFFLDSAFLHPPGPRHAVVAALAALAVGPLWLFTWRCSRRELRRRSGPAREGLGEDGEAEPLPMNNLWT